MKNKMRIERDIRKMRREIKNLGEIDNK